MEPQSVASGRALGMDDWSLVPPNSPQFSVAGTSATVERARVWALARRLLLYRGTGENCVHGLYRMDICSFRVCRTVGLDHTTIWVGHDARAAFLLTQPYVTDVPDRLRLYAEMHGLRIETHPMDDWYGHGTLPIRLTLPGDWPLWPIERDAALVLHTQPVPWPEDE